MDRLPVFITYDFSVISTKSRPPTSSDALQYVCDSSSRKLSLARRPTLTRSAGGDLRFLVPPTVPLTVLSKDEWANDPSHANINTTLHDPGPHPRPPTPLRSPASQQDAGGRLDRSGSVDMRPAPYGGPSCPAPLFGGGAGWVCPVPYGGPSCPAPTWGAGAVFV